MVQASVHADIVAAAIAEFGETFVKPGEGIIALSGIAFGASCDHDGDPFTGTVSIAYEPAEVICGLGGFARAVSTLTSIPQLQEQLGQDLVDAINGALSAKGVLVQIDAHHECLSSRVASAKDSRLRTVTFSGSLADDSARLSAMLLLAGGA